MKIKLNISIKSDIIKSINLDINRWRDIMEMSDVLVIGGGPAGLNASLYAARKALSVTLVSTDIGGQMMLTNEIENYLGFQSVTGIELAEKMEAHVRQYPVDFVTAGVKTLKHLSDGSFAVQLDDGKSLQGKTVIVTAGKKSRTLDIPGEIEYTGRGVSYCATCDGPFYRNKTVAIVGGGDSAVQAAIEMSMISQKVYLLVRSRIRAAEIVVKRMYEKKISRCLWNTFRFVLMVNGKSRLSLYEIRRMKRNRIGCRWCICGSRRYSKQQLFTERCHYKFFRGNHYR